MMQTKKLSAARRRAVRALVSASSLADAASQARVREETLWRWLSHDEDFRQAVKNERAQRREVACMAAESLLQVAVETLETVLMDGSVAAETRVAAARATFEIAVQLYELTVLEQRVDALEGRSRERRGRPSGDLKVVAAGAERPA